jgi:hypothetical protein
MIVIKVEDKIESLKEYGGDLQCVEVSEAEDSSHRTAGADASETTNGAVRQMVPTRQLIFTYVKALDTMVF